MKNINDELVKHYNCFNTERFFVDEHDEKIGFLSIVASSIEDSCPYTLCRNIAKFCKKNIEHENYPFIYVGAWIFKTDKL